MIQAFYRALQCIYGDVYLKSNLGSFQILENGNEPISAFCTMLLIVYLLQCTACARSTAEVAGRVQNEQASNQEALTGSKAANCDEVALRKHVSRHVKLRKVVLVLRSWEQHLKSIAATTRAVVLALIV
jgi:hypothetical protein